MPASMPVIGYTRRGRPIFAIGGADGTRRYVDVLADQRAAEERETTLRDEGDRHLAMHGVADGQWDSTASAERAGQLTDQLTAARAQVSALRQESRDAMLADYQAGRFATESVGESLRAEPTRPSGPGWEVRSAALRTIERIGSLLPARSQDRLDALVRDEDDPGGLGARYIAAAGAPDYASAFAVMVRAGGGPHAAYELTPTQLAAVRQVREAERALGIGTQGGAFALPITLDPAVIATSDGVVNPLRRIARVETISGYKWSGVTSAGVTAGYLPEFTEANDDSPTLEGPEVVPARGTSFVPFSIEVGMDWPGGGLLSELRRLFEDARDAVDATKMLFGSGTNEPAGLIAGLDAGQEISGTADIDGLNDLVGDLPPRWQPRATAIANLAAILAARRLSGPGSEDEWPVVNEAMDRLLGRPLVEMSTMPADTFIYGDFRQFVVVDRIGSQIELIPHLMGSNRRPTGERGAFFYWRSGSAVLVPDAFRIVPASSS